MRAAMSASRGEAAADLAFRVSGLFSAVPTGSELPSTRPAAAASALGFSMSGRISAALPGNGANAGSPHQSPPANLHRFQQTDVDQFINLGAPDPERTRGFRDGDTDRFHRPPHLRAADPQRAAANGVMLRRPDCADKRFSFPHT